MRLSAIVPTHERPLALRRCLETLQRQSLDGAQFEVIVVDDGSRSDLGALVERIGRAGQVPMRFHRQPLGGLNRARKRGIEAAQGQIVALLDDDTLVAPGWAQALVRAFEDPRCAGVGGRIVLATENPIPDWIAVRDYYLGAYNLGPLGRWIEHTDPVPVGANCAVRRAVFAEVGAFVPGLDRIGGSLISNGDTEFFRRLRDAGGRLWYEPAAAVEHCIPASRLTVGYMARRHRAQGISNELLSALDSRARVSDRRRAVAALLPAELKHIAKVLVQDLLAGRGPIGTYMAINYWAGRVKGAGVETGSLRLDPAVQSPPRPAPEEPPPR